MAIPETGSDLAELKQMNTALEKSTKNLLDSMYTATVFIDNKLDILHMNASAELMLGASREMTLNKNIFKALPCCDIINTQLQKALDSQRVYSERNLEIQLNPKHKITLDCIITPVFDDELANELIIIELTQVDRQLRISREDHLISQSEGTRDLLRGVAHEIKNPLGGIRGAAQLLADELPDPGYSEYTDVIIHEVDRLQNLVDRMLGPRQLPQIEDTNIHEILENIRKLISVEAGDNLKIISDYDPSLPDIKADKEMLQQAFLNVVRNALQAVQGLDPAEIFIRTRPERQFTINHIRHRLVLKIEIIDNGPGIPTDMRETIFLPMVTSKSEGTGLGLPIAQSLIQRHGGLIEFGECDSKTCFIIYLPLESSYANNK
jgi:two-component system nitrogen regulation sensor histidine kinase GlnL